jgi:hypothetical protein
MDGENGWSLYAENNAQSNRPSSSRSFWLIILTAALGAGVFASIWVSPQDIILGLCGSLTTAGSLVLLEEVLRMQKHERTANSVDGLLQRSPSSSSREQEEAWIIMRKMALAVAAPCLVASLLLENFQVGELTFRPELGIYSSWSERWKAQQYSYNIEGAVSGIVLETLKAITLLSVVCLPPSIQLPFPTPRNLRLRHTISSSDFVLIVLSPFFFNRTKSDKSANTRNPHAFNPPFAEWQFSKIVTFSWCSASNSLAAVCF